MILGPISFVDCFVFVLVLIPQLFHQVGVLQTLIVAIQVVPFFIFQLPIQFIRNRVFLKPTQRPAFFQTATTFQEVVIRCVRYAFANIPAKVGRVFFSKWVAYPFFRFRLLRHGYLRSPIYFQEVNRYGINGLWIIQDETRDPDIIIYYCHGGGFSMGSSYFYLEFLIAWITRLKSVGYRNPAVFALEYTLVPDAKWPKQFNETCAGYRFLLDTFGDGNASKICVSGDSAGATLILSMLLQPGSLDQEPQFHGLDRPGLAILLSPWTHLVSELNQNTLSDYLDKNSLHLYAQQYAGGATMTDEVISPGLCVSRWKRASPRNGYRILHGAEEVFEPGIEEMIHHMKNDGAIVKSHRRKAGIHAWPVVSLFLGQNTTYRLEGLDIMTEFIVSSNINPKE